MLGFKRDEKDGMYNRRRMAVFVLCYAIIWGFIILTVDVLFEFDTAKVTVYLGFVATVGGLPVWQYLRAAQQNGKGNQDGKSDDNAKS